MEKKIATDTPLYRHDAAYARQHDAVSYTHLTLPTICSV